MSLLSDKEEGFSLPIDTSNLDTARLHPLANLSKGIEYLDLEEEQLSTVQGSEGILPSRGWSDDLCYGTGTLYLLGLGTGGIIGFYDGLKQLNRNYSGKLKLNTILNGITRRGPMYGNNCGVVAMIYNIANSSFAAYRGKHDTYGSMAAGAVTGAIFKSTRGTKQMGIAASLMALGAGGWSKAQKKLMA